MNQTEPLQPMEPDMGSRSGEIRMQERERPMEPAREARP